MLQQLLLATALASSYVLAIRTRVPVHFRSADRNDPALIRFRMGRVLMLCAMVLAGLPPVLVHGFHSYGTLAEVYRHFGLVPGFSASGSVILDVANVLWYTGLLCVLYMGPIAHYMYTRRMKMKDDFFFSFCVLGGFRDHVFAPITEEFIYRAAIIATLKPVLSNESIIKWLPCFFGVAHVHHGLALFSEGYSLAATLMHVVVQLVYTTLFGLLANKIYLESKCNLWSVVVVHAICNLLGFPSLEVKTTHPRWLYGYCALLGLGLYLFWTNL